MNFLAFPQSAALWSVLLLLLTIPPATAQSLPSLPIQFNPDNLINPGRPGNRRRGGGSRGGCQAEIPLTAISYADSRTVEELGVTRIEETVGTLTTKAQPTLLFYLPQPLSENTTTELIVQDQHRQLLFQGQLMGQTEHSGVVSVPITVDLALNTPYYWALTLNCTDGSTAVDGWIERRANAPALTRTFNETNPRNRAALYASYGFLQDMLSELAALRLTQPDNDAIAQDWSNVLGLLDLADLVTAPVLDCCQVADDSLAPQQPPL